MILLIFATQRKLSRSQQKQKKSETNISRNSPNFAAAKFVKCWEMFLCVRQRGWAGDGWREEASGWQVQTIL